jgi:hypothetical protein
MGQARWGNTVGATPLGQPCWDNPVGATPLGAIPRTGHRVKDNKDISSDDKRLIRRFLTVRPIYSHGLRILYAKAVVVFGLRRPRPKAAIATAMMALR